MLPVSPVGLAVPAIIALGVIDRHRENHSDLRRQGRQSAPPLPSEGRG